MKRVLTLVLPILLALLALTACGSDSGDSSGSAESTQAGDHSGMPSMSMSMPMSMPAGAEEQGGKEIVISDFKYTLPGTFAPGEQVTVRNNDTAEHTVTADTGDLFDVEIKAGETATFTAPGQPGTFAFHCTYHPNMVGTLEVR